MKMIASLPVVTTIGERSSIWISSLPLLELSSSEEESGSDNKPLAVCAFFNATAGVLGEVSESESESEPESSELELDPSADESDDGLAGLICWTFSFSSSEVSSWLLLLESSSRIAFCAIGEFATGIGLLLVLLLLRSDSAVLD